MRFIVLIILIIKTFNYETKESLIAQFFENYKKASKDDLNYYIDYFNKMGNIDLVTLFQDSELISQFFYINNKPKGYIVSFPNQDYFIFSIFVNFTVI
jgi:hypothetical protein